FEGLSRFRAARWSRSRVGPVALLAVPAATVASTRNVRTRARRVSMFRSPSGSGRGAVTRTLPCLACVGVPEAEVAKPRVPDCAGVPADGGLAPVDRDDLHR